MKHSILVIEDNPHILTASCEYLSDCGYDVDGSAQAEDAKRKIEQRLYSLVLCDVRLQGAHDNCDGLALAEFVDARRHGTPVILLTACADSDMYLRAVRCGVIRVLNKPQPLSRIASIVTETLRQRYDRFFAL